MPKWLNSVDGGIWYYALGGSGFLVSDFDNVGCTQSYELTEFGTKARVDLEFGGGEYRVEVYEGSLTTPAWTRLFSAAGGDQGIGNVCTGVLPGPAQGDEFGACYQDRTCNSGLTCAMGKSCDAVGLATCCLAESTAPASTGANGEACNQDGACNSGLACITGGACGVAGCCVETGQANGACTSEGDCDEGFECRFDPECDPEVNAGTCCMFVDEPGPVGSGGPLPNPPEEGCASDGSCQPGFACVQGPICDDLVNCCVQAGDVGQPCLAGGTCSEALVCSDDPECDPEIGQCCLPGAGEPGPPVHDGGAAPVADDASAP